MLWRKTKLFKNNEVSKTTAIDSRTERRKSTRRRKAPLTVHKLQFQTTTSTPSYIEFYYLDDNDERLKRTDTFIKKAYSREKHKAQSRHLTRDNTNKKRERYPIQSFHINKPGFQLVVPPSQTSNPNFHQKPKLHSKTFYDKQSMYDFIRNKLKSKSAILAKIQSTSKATSSENSYSGETCPATFDIIHENSTALLSSENNFIKYDTTSTEFYDKIKFFEIYDQHTQSPENKLILLSRGSENKIQENYVDSKQVLLEDINKNIGHHDGLYQKHVKKHVHDDIKEDNKHKTNNNNIDELTNIKFQMHSENHTYKYQKSTSKLHIFTTDEEKSSNYTLAAARNASKPVLWSNYPFAAVYIYEPSQIHCDAAALSPHWLLASGACLSRYHSQDPVNEGRSAFVSYCSENWWQPERVIYVKYIIVHPRYHPNDEIRRYMYNIGLIQIAGSMASACFNWSPISIMSHHFAASSGGTLGAAVGWGLDRYDVRYFGTHVPKIPLHIYKALTYSSYCPGDTGYSEMKSKNEAGVTKNIYCLLLPPYRGEDDDPVHGSMLLVGGKLIALYIQEERRSWGIQSAQYTGVWRLVPWIHEVAREQENADSFNIDI
ncbi:hypothetical protein evm_008265 [Chilo suppressalis]|nr:hypothetical protein evm_008265 [Chilo suppressalis]